MKYFQVVYCHVNKTSWQYTALYTSYSYVLDGEIKAITANLCLMVRTCGDTPAALIVCQTPSGRHQHVAQCCRNTLPSFSMCLCKQKVCLGLNKSKNSEKKVMIWGIHYFITKIKTKIDVIPRSRFNFVQMQY